MGTEVPLFVANSVIRHVISYLPFSDKRAKQSLLEEEETGRWSARLATKSKAQQPDGCEHFDEERNEAIRSPFSLPLHHTAHTCAACRHSRSFLLRKVDDRALGGEEHSGY